jgi:uncharacterized protein (DUF924 family)
MNTGAQAGVDEPDWVGEVLDFWFGELGPRQWFSHDAAVDAAIAARFGELPAHLLATPAREVEFLGGRAVRAAVLVLDQFSRNLHRGSAQAFAGDELARQLAREAIACGEDARLSAAERLFLYLPFEHSEELADQELSLCLHEQLGEAEWTRYAVAHRDLIARFGRFPHRNAVLGRQSTPEEIAAMAGPMGKF